MITSTYHPDKLDLCSLWETPLFHHELRIVFGRTSTKSTTLFKRFSSGKVLPVKMSNFGLRFVTCCLSLTAALYFRNADWSWNALDICIAPKIAGLDCGLYELY